MRLLVLMTLVCMLSRPADAKHYRGGTFYWDWINSAKVKITWRLAFRNEEVQEEEKPLYPCDYVGQEILAEELNMLNCTTCSYNKKIIVHRLPLTCIETRWTGLESDWNLYKGSYVYDAEKSKFKMSYGTKKGSCIDSSWLGLNNYGHGKCWNLQTNVDLSTGNNSPRVTAGLPLYRIRKGCEMIIDLKPIDPDGDTIRCRWAERNKQECPDRREKQPTDIQVCGNPSEDHANLYKNQCQIKFEAEKAQVGYYGVSVMIEDFNKGSTKPKSTVPYQFLIEVTEPGSCIGPTVTLSTNCSEIRPGDSWQNIVTVDLPHDSEGNRVEELMYSLPMGMSYDEDIPPPARHVQSILSFQSNDVGVYEYSVTATDDYGSQGKPAFGKIKVTDDVDISTSSPNPEILNRQSYPRSGSELDDTTRPWFIQFDGPVSRPGNSSFITIVDMASNELARYDASNPDEVEFPKDDPTIARYKAPKDLEAGEAYFIEIEKGFAVVKYPTYCHGAVEYTSLISGYGFSIPTPPEPDVDCGQNEITAYVPKSYVSDLSVNELHLIDPRCKSKDNGTHLIVKFAYDTCGTYIKKKSSDLTRFVNILRDDPKPYKTSNDITRKKRQVNIKIICDVEGVGIANVFFNPDTSVTSKRFKSRTRLEAYLELHEDKSYSTMVPYGTEKNAEFSDRLYFAARADDSSKEVAIESCRATAQYKTCSKYDKKFEFISNGCPVDDTVKFTNSGSFDQKRFSIKTFAMIDFGLDDTVWVTCSFVTCDPSDSQSACKDLNSPSCDPASVGRRRRKRSATDVVTQAFLEVQIDTE